VNVARHLKSAVERAGILIIAVRPASVTQMLDEVARCGVEKMPRIAVSLAAGIPLKQLRARIDSCVRWGRAMPSPVCRIGLGLTALTFDRKMPISTRKHVQKFFERVGPTLELPESKFDAFTVAYSPTHGYHALATLAKAAQKAGLDRKTALTA